MISLTSFSREYCMVLLMYFGEFWWIRNVSNKASWPLEEALCFFLGRGLLVAVIIGATTKDSPDFLPSTHLSKFAHKNLSHIPSKKWDFYCTVVVCSMNMYFDHIVYRLFAFLCHVLELCLCLRCWHSCDNPQVPRPLVQTGVGVPLAPIGPQDQAVHWGQCA